MTREIVNTWDQNVAAGGDRIAIYYCTPDKWRQAAWKVARFKNGKEVATDPAARFEDRGAKSFLCDYPLREGKPKAFAAAQAWVSEKYGAREFVRNRMGDYVERDVNERYPIPKRDSR